MMGMRDNNGSWFAVVAISRRFVLGFKPCHITSLASQHFGGARAYEPAPARALNSSRSGVEFIDKNFIASKISNNGILERAIFHNTTMTLLFGGRSQVLPEQRVVDVA